MCDLESNIVINLKKNMVQVTCTYGSQMSNYPCSICWCDKTQLRNVGERIEERTEGKMKERLELIEKATTTTEANRISKQYSMHPIPVSEMSG